MTAQREWFEKDYYAVLGVPAGASDKEVSKAYKKLAKQFHPDANPGDRAAEERFKEISAAYDVLGDAAKRVEYDEVRRMVASGVGPGGFGGPGGFQFDVDEGGGFSDLLGGLFGGRGGRGRRGTGPQRGRDLETELHLGFVEAVNGVTSTVRFRADAPCSQCGGSGARAGTSPELCTDCRGTGHVAVDQGPFSFSQVCPRCAGAGRIVREPCPRCRGRGVEVAPREVKVRVPPGVDDGGRIRVKGRGSAGANGGPAGDLYVIVHVRPHPLFGRDGRNLTLRLPISFAEATLGADVKVPTLEDPVTVRIAAGTPSGKTLRVRGRGVRSDGTGAPGDLLVTVEVVVPEDLTDDQRRAVEGLAAAFAEDPRGGLMERQHNRRRTDDGD